MKNIKRTRRFYVTAKSLTTAGEFIYSDAVFEIDGAVTKDTVQHWKGLFHKSEHEHKRLWTQVTNWIELEG